MNDELKTKRWCCSPLTLISLQYISHIYLGKSTEMFGKGRALQKNDFRHDRNVYHPRLLKYTLLFYGKSPMAGGSEDFNHIWPNYWKLCSQALWHTGKRTSELIRWAESLNERWNIYSISFTTVYSDYNSDYNKENFIQPTSVGLN